VQELMTTQEVADYLRIKERKIYDLVQRGAIPCSRARAATGFCERC